MQYDSVMKYSKLFVIVLLAALAAGCKTSPRFVITGTLHLESNEAPVLLPGAAAAALAAKE